MKNQPNNGLLPFIISLPLPVDHPRRGCALRRMLEIEGSYIPPARGEKITVRGLSPLPVVSVTWESRRGHTRRIVTVDLAPTGTQIAIDEEKLKQLGYEVFIN